MSRFELKDAPFHWDRGRLARTRSHILSTCELKLLSVSLSLTARRFFLGPAVNVVSPEPQQITHAGIRQRVFTL